MIAYFAAGARRRGLAEQSSAACRVVAALLEPRDPSFAATRSRPAPDALDRVTGRERICFEAAKMRANIDGKPRERRHDPPAVAPADSVAILLLGLALFLLLDLERYFSFEMLSRNHAALTSWVAAHMALAALPLRAGLRAGGGLLAADRRAGDAGRRLPVRPVAGRRCCR